MKDINIFTNQQSSKLKISQYLHSNLHAYFSQEKRKTFITPLKYSTKNIFRVPRKDFNFMNMFLNYNAIVIRSLNEAVQYYALIKNGSNFPYTKVSFIS